MRRTITILVITAALTALLAPSVSAILLPFSDNFDGRSTGDLVGQGPWANFGTSATVNASSNTNFVTNHITNKSDEYWTNAKVMFDTPISDGQVIIEYDTSITYTPDFTEDQVLFWLIPPSGGNFEGPKMSAKSGNIQLDGGYYGATIQPSEGSAGIVHTTMVVDLDAGTFQLTHDDIATGNNLYTYGPKTNFVTQPIPSSLAGVGFWLGTWADWEGGQGAGMDNFSITPEPAPAAILACGLVALVRRTRR